MRPDVSRSWPRVCSRLQPPWPRRSSFFAPASAPHIDVSCAEAILIATNLLPGPEEPDDRFVPPAPGRMIMFPGIEATSDG